MRPFVGRRSADQIEAVGAVESPKNIEVREALDIGKTELKLRQDLEHALRQVFGAEALGNGCGLLVSTVDASNGHGLEHKGAFFSISN